MKNPVINWQMLSKNPERTAVFYSETFGWKISTANALNYREVKTEAPGGIDGGIWPIPSTNGQSTVQLFIAVEDVSTYARRAVDHGATIIVPPQKLPDGDEMAVLSDPEGVSFGLMKARNR